MHATKKIIALAWCYAVLLAAPLGAQETARRVSLPEALRLFGENSLALRIARAEAFEAQGAARQSRAYFNPELTLVREDLGRGTADYWETTIGVEQRLEWPGRTAARSRAAGHRIGAATAGFRADSLRLAFEVRRTYAETWWAEERRSTIARAVEVIGRVADAAERRLEEGDISGYEARRLRVERARVGQDLALAELDAAAARRGLAARVLPETDILEVWAAEPLIGRPPVVTREDALGALSSRPDLEAASRALDASRAELSVARASRFPGATLGLGYKDQSDGFSGAAVTLTVPVLLFDRRGGARDGAAARQDAAESTLELRSREARNDVLAAFDRYASMRDRTARIGDGLLEDADALLESAETAYGEGELTLVQLLDAARAFRDARLTAVSLRAETWIAYFDLMRAMGRAPEDDR